MDPSIYLPNLPYTPPAGLPQESKLVTYMNRSSSTPARPLSQAMAGLSLDDSNSAGKQVREFIPMNYYAQPMMPESPGGSPPSVLAAHMGGGPGSHMGGVSQGSHMGGGPGSHMGGVSQGSHMGGGPGSHMGGGPGSHMGGGPGSHMGGMPPGHMGGLQGSHMGSMQQAHMNSNVQAQHMQPPPTQMLHENVGGTTYFFPSDSINPSASLNASAEAACMAVGPPIIVPSPYATQMYIPMPTHMHPMPSKPGLAATFYQPETIRAEVYQRNEAVFLPQQDIQQFPTELPENLDIYTQPILLEGIIPHSMSSSYRVTHRQTGEHYAMRRLHSYGTCPSKRLEMWKQIDHPNVVTFHDHLTTNAFGDHSMLLIYTYHPSCITLMNKYLVGCGNPVSDGASPFVDPFSSDPDAPRPYTHQKNAMLRAVASGALLPEAVLWSLIVQLTAALRAIHTAGLACRGLDPSKVIMNGCRARISWCGAPDALHPSTGDVNQAQQEDLTALGRLALSLACRTPHCDNIQSSLDVVTRSYSPDLKNVIIYLLSGTQTRRSVTDLMPMIGARFYTQVEALQRRTDAFEDLLAHEIDNGRLFRILVKLATCNDRPELNCDPTWSETGHRYLLKLFRDYIFHSVTPEGRPWIDQAHVVNCLNLLDGGAPDRGESDSNRSAASLAQHADKAVPLMSRDETSILVVSYAELKHSLETSFDELMQASGGP